MPLPLSTHPIIHDLLLLLRGLRNGLYYGAKVRLPHALVMTLLFRAGTLQEKLRSVLHLTVTHARNLGLFVLTFKLLRRLLIALGLPATSVLTNFAPGFLSGQLIFSTNTPVSQQILLYLLSRTIYASAAQIFKRTKQFGPLQAAVDSGAVWRVFAGTVWGVVMTQFYLDPDSLVPSLESSMRFLYLDSEQWQSWTDFVPLPFIL
jgi:peroxisomal membrane protein 4